MIELSDEQKEVVESDTDHILVTGGAGSGKTTALAEYAGRHSGRDGHPRTIVLARTNTVADVIRARIADGHPYILDRIYVGTVHGFCLDIVRSHGQTVGVNPNSRVFESDADRLWVFRQALMGMPSETETFGDMDVGSVDDAIWTRFRRMIGRKATLECLGEPDAVADEYDELMRSIGAMDYDDVVLCALRIMTEQPRIARRYRGYYGCICVDEAQDLNRAQYSFVRALAGDSMRIVLAGDPNQATYGLSGASNRFMCEDYPRDFDVLSIELRGDHRS